MTTRISQTASSPQAASAICAPKFMVLGLFPNTMNRFKHSYSHEVLFVN
ncbi:MAG: hypothetical protein WCG50_15145 [Rhodoferax sp.]